MVLVNSDDDDDDEDLLMRGPGYRKKVPAKFSN